jgi:hypothetical protein
MTIHAGSPIAHWQARVLDRCGNDAVWPPGAGYNPIDYHRVYPPSTTMVAPVM